MPFRPASCDISEYGQNGNLVVVVPKKRRMAPEKDPTKTNDEKASAERAEKIATMRRNFLSSVQANFREQPGGLRS